VRNVVFALSLGEVDQRHSLIAGETAKTLDERPADRLQQRRRRKPVTPMLAQARHHATDELQLRHVHVQEHPVDALDLQGHVVGQNV
jgi:hypothetical protein